MKKNITVNMFGTLYPIDEDAYELLGRYLDNMRAYFSRQEGGGEIADDIEARVAELLAEIRGECGNPVTIEDVQNIISRIGNPEEMGCGYERGEAADGEDAASEPCSVPKKLYRDMNNRMLGGVLAGLGCYLGVNPVWLRLLMIVIAVMSYGVMAVAYVICWIVLPPAVTPAARLEMQGRPVNIANLREEILNEGNPRVRRGFGSVVDGVMQVICFVFKAMLYVGGGLLLLLCVGGLIAVLSAVCWYGLSIFDGVAPFDSDSRFGQFADVCPMGLLWLCCISLIVVLSLTIYFGVALILRQCGRRIPVPASVTVICIVGWFVALVLFIGSWARGLYHVERWEWSQREIRHAEWQQHQDERKQERINELAEYGWTLTKERNTSHYMKSGEFYSGNRSRKYLDAYAKDGNMVYEAVRNVKVAPGTYRLSAVARTNGNGCEIFAVNGTGKRYVAEVPVCENKGGSIWADAKKKLEGDSTIIPDRGRLKDIANVNRGKGYGWSRVEIQGIKVGADSVLTYGVTNDGAAKTWDGTWLSATTFELVPSKNQGASR